MCVGIPMQLVRIDGSNGWAMGTEGEEQIDLSLIGTQPVGTWVLNFLGAARAVIDEDEAMKIGKALDALRSIQTGGGVGDAFDDIAERGPQLPPHLEAARAAGKTTG